MIKEVIETIKKEYRKAHPKPKAFCIHCNRPIFNLDSIFGRRRECTYCYNAYKRGKEERKE